MRAVRTPTPANWPITSRTAEYAIRAVLYIAGRAGDGPVAVAQIAPALHVPEKYLARVLSTLRRADVLCSTRGAHGGFRLARTAAQLTLADIVAPFAASDAPPQCLLRGEQCGAGVRCPAHKAWHGVADGIRDFFQRTTLADLLTGAARQASTSSNHSGECT